MKTNVFHSVRQASCDMLFLSSNLCILVFLQRNKARKFEKKETSRETQKEKYSE